MVSHVLPLGKDSDVERCKYCGNKARVAVYLGYPWFKSYWSQRQQIVNVIQVDSIPMEITCGVPQGSILGPLLFPCFVNDMPTNCNLILFIVICYCMLMTVSFLHLAKILRQFLTF